MPVPLWMIDAVANEYWFSRIPREHGLIEGYAKGAPLAIPVVMGGLMAVLIAAWYWAPPPHRPARWLFFLLATAAMILTILQTRKLQVPGGLHSRCSFPPS